MQASSSNNNNNNNNNNLQSTTNPGVSAWQVNTAYTAGQLVTYNGKTYKCLQPHTSLAGWEPSNVPALWQLQ
ncbi:carbohydrate-binding protein [Escherichia coli]|uniref:carbohydrate-binding protein n=1 Tax=Escherichia coli TaxID=562 RepID=UPI0032E51FC1